MAKLFEQTTIIHLTDVQKTILAKVFSSPTPKVAYEETTQGSNFNTGRTLLVKYGILNQTNDGLSLSDKGMSLMKDEDLLDDSNNLTDKGKKFAEVKSYSDLSDVEQPEDNSEANNNTLKELFNKYIR